MKKLFALSILFLFVLSIAAIAEDDTNATNESANGKEKLMDKIKDIKQERQQVKGDYLQAKDKYIEARQIFLEQRQDFIKERMKLLNCTDNETSDCKDARAQIKVKALSYLAGIADVVLESLNNAKARVEASNMSDKEDVLATLDERITAVEDAKATIENSNSTQEIKDAIKDIRKAWVDTKPVLKGAVDKVVNERIGGIIVQSERLSAKLDKIITRLESKGYNTTNASALVADFKAKIAEAKTHYEAAKSKFNAKDIEAGHAAMVKAHQNLKEARVILKEIVSAIKGENAKALDETNDNNVEKTDKGKRNETENNRTAKVNETNESAGENETD